MTLDIAEASNTSIYNPQVAQQLLLSPAGLLTVHMMVSKGFFTPHGQNTASIRTEFGME